jgi:hypothetical protein
VYLCVHMYTDLLYRCLVVSLGLDQCTQTVQYIPRSTYRRLPTNQGPAGGYSSDQSEAEKIRQRDSIGSLYIDGIIWSLKYHTAVLVLFSLVLYGRARPCIVFFGFVLGWVGDPAIFEG